jgi:hypothetical protein
MRGCRRAFGLFVSLTCALAPPAGAEVRVNGSPTVVHITTRDDTISDVLSVIAKTFNVPHSNSFRHSSQRNLFGFVPAGDFAPARWLQLRRQDRSGRDGDRRFRQTRRCRDRTTAAQARIGQRHRFSMAMTAGRRPRGRIQTPTMGRANRCACAATGKPPIHPREVPPSHRHLRTCNTAGVSRSGPYGNEPTLTRRWVSQSSWQHERCFTYRDASIYLVVSAGRGSRSVSHAAGAIVSAPLAVRLPGDAIGRPSIGVRSPDSCARNYSAPPRCYVHRRSFRLLAHWLGELQNLRAELVSAHPGGRLCASDVKRKIKINLNLQKFSQCSIRALADHGRHPMR